MIGPNQRCATCAFRNVGEGARKEPDNVLRGMIAKLTAPRVRF